MASQSQPRSWTVPNLALNKGANSFEIRATFPVTYSSNYSIQRVTYPKTASGNLARHAIQMKGAELGGTADLSFARTHRKLQNLAGLPNEVSGAEALANVKQHLMAD